MASVARDISMDYCTKLIKLTLNKVVEISTIVGSPGKLLQGYLSKEEPVYKGNDWTSEVSLIYSK